MSNVFLDIDDSIQSKSLLLPDKKRDLEIEEQIENEFQTTPFILIQPTPGICVKTKTEAGEKIFINICVANEIPPPAKITEGQLLAELRKHSPAFTIPMSVGHQRLEVDKGGTPCITYDIAINETYLEQCKKSHVFMSFTISVIVTAVSEKSGIPLKEDYVILKKRKFIGTIQQQKIQDRRVKTSAPKKLIEEISTNKNENFTSQETLKNASSVTSNADYLILREPAKGTVERLIGLFHLPKDVTSKDLSVLLDTTRIIVTIEHLQFTRDVAVPYNMNPEAVKGLLDRDVRVLRLNIPVVSS